MPILLGLALFFAVAYALDANQVFRPAGVVSWEGDDGFYHAWVGKVEVPKGTRVRLLDGSFVRIVGYSNGWLYPVEKQGSPIAEWVGE